MALRERWQRRQLVGAWKNVGRKQAVDADSIVLPVRFPNDAATAMLSDNWWVLEEPCKAISFGRLEDGTLQLQTLPTPDLLDNQFARRALMLSYDLLAKCDREMFELPHDVLEAAHKYEQFLNAHRLAQQTVTGTVD